jgi:hypothetical protein
MIAGITGHQNLGDEETISWIENCLEQELRKYNITIGLTCLAIGADQLFAQVLDKFNIPYIAIVPSEKYVETFAQGSDRENYNKYLIKAKEAIKLDFPAPSEQAYYEAGKYVVDHSDMLFAIWNGKAAKGLGGTGDVVKYGKMKKKKIVHINPVTREIKFLK